MVSLHNHLNQLDFANQLVEVNRLINQSEVKVSFWGNRVIKFEGYKGTISLDIFVSRVLKASRERANQPLEVDEKNAMENLDEVLNHFYTTSDHMVKNSNCLTKILNWFKEFTCWPYTPRFYIEEHILLSRHLIRN